MSILPLVKGVASISSFSQNCENLPKIGYEKGMNLAIA